MSEESDRELLEWAAKAAGLDAHWGNGFQSDRLFVPANASSGIVTGIEWNPLTDDGDALRMAVNLAMELIITFDYVRIVCGKANISEYFHATDDYRFIATRRAITRAAAAIGKAMK